MKLKVKACIIKKAAAGGPFEGHWDPAPIKTRKRTDKTRYSILENDTFHSDVLIPFIKGCMREWGWPWTQEQEHYQGIENAGAELQVQISKIVKNLENKWDLTFFPREND